MTDETMKAGPELDARLCELLEKKPPDVFPWQQPESDVPLYESHEGFWRRSISWRETPDELSLRPIPVSTDWAAMGKIVDVLGPDHDITMEHAPHPFPARASLFKYSTGSGRGSGDTIPHAFALAACEVLEKRAKAKP